MGRYLDSSRNHGDARGQRPLRLLTLTTLFPNTTQRRHGVFVANRLRRLCDSGRCEATVIAALPWFPGAYRGTAAVPRMDVVHGFTVHHPRYLHVPAVGMRWQPAMVARALLREVDRIGSQQPPFDLVDAHYFFPDGVAAARVANVLQLPLVISARGSDINLISSIAFARRRMLRAAMRSQALIAVSVALKSRMEDIGMPADRIHVLRNGVDMNCFAPYPREVARRNLHLAESGSLVLAVGNLVPEKGLELLIRAVSSIDHLRLLIVGEGPMRTSLGRLAARLAPGRVEFRENMPQHELRVAYAAANVLGHPSLREGWPNVVLESIACGTPILASSVGGIPEILGPCAPGILMDTRDVDAWSSALTRLLHARWDPDVVRQYAKRFEWDMIVERQCQLYQEVVDEWRGACERDTWSSSSISCAAEK